VIRFAVFLTALLGLLVPVIARADVTTGNAVPGLKGYAERHATEMMSVAPLSPALQGKPLVVRIHADWCPACKATQSTIDQIKASYGPKINFVQFDVTNANTAADAQRVADNLGLAAFLRATEAATSTVAIIDPWTGKVMATFYNDDQAADYQKVIDSAIIAQHH
jgi:thiol-disulfide isomerase/thioredoxin